MEKSSYQKLRRKLDSIQRWIYIKEWEWSKDTYPEKEIILKLLKELQERLNETEEKED